MAAPRYKDITNANLELINRSLSESIELDRVYLLLSYQPEHQLSKIYANLELTNRSLSMID